MNGDIKFKKFPLINAAKEELAKITLEHLWADVFALKLKVLNMEAVSKLSGVIQEVLKESNDFKARLVMFRLGLWVHRYSFEVMKAQGGKMEEWINWIKEGAPC